MRELAGLYLAVIFWFQSNLRSLRPFNARKALMSWWYSFVFSLLFIKQDVKIEPRVI